MMPTDTHERDGTNRAIQLQTLRDSDHDPVLMEASCALRIMALIRLWKF